MNNYVLQKDLRHLLNLREKEKITLADLADDADFILMV
jgi:hypothetical protein